MYCMKFLIADVEIPYFFNLCKIHMNHSKDYIKGGFSQISCFIRIGLLQHFSIFKILN